VLKVDKIEDLRNRILDNYDNLLKQVIIGREETRKVLEKGDFKNQYIKASAQNNHLTSEHLYSAYTENKEYVINKKINDYENAMKDHRFQEEDDLRISFEETLVNNPYFPIDFQKHLEIYKESIKDEYWEMKEQQSIRSQEISKNDVLIEKKRLEMQEAKYKKVSEQEAEKKQNRTFFQKLVDRFKKEKPIEPYLYTVSKKEALDTLLTEQYRKNRQEEAQFKSKKLKENLEKIKNNVSLRDKKVTKVADNELSL
jgi:hypothetical protein